MNIVEKLREMVGKSFLYNTREHKIRGFALKDGKAFIYTDKTTIKGEATKEFLNEFLPIEEDFEEHSLQLLPDRNQMMNLKEILLDNIKKVKEDKSYIPQANSINKNINTLLNMAKLELEYYRTLKK